LPTGNGCLTSVLSLLLIFLPGAGTALAHSDHGDVTPPAGGISIVTLERFQAELFTPPHPPLAVAGSKIVLTSLLN